EHAEIAHLAPEVGRELVLAVDVGGARRDLVGGEAHDRGAQHVGGLAQVEVQRRQGVGDHRARLPEGSPTTEAWRHRRTATKRVTLRLDPRLSRRRPEMPWSSPGMTRRCEGLRLSWPLRCLFLYSTGRLGHRL